MQELVHAALQRQLFELELVDYTFELLECLNQHTHQPILRLFMLNDVESCNSDEL